MIGCVHLQQRWFSHQSLWFISFTFTDRFLVHHLCQSLFIVRVLANQLVMKIFQLILFQAHLRDVSRIVLQDDRQGKSEILPRSRTPESFRIVQRVEHEHHPVSSKESNSKSKIGLYFDWDSLCLYLCFRFVRVLHGDLAWYLRIRK